jgi:hypothetical protein
MYSTRRKSRDLHFYVDYRKLNVTNDCFLLLSIDDTLDMLAREPNGS